MGRRMSMNMRTVVSESARGAILLADANEILRQMLLPDAGVGGASGMDGADARVGVGLEHGVGVRARPEIVGAVRDAGDA